MKTVFTIVIGVYVLITIILFRIGSVNKHRGTYVSDEEYKEFLKFVESNKKDKSTKRSKGEA